MNYFDCSPVPIELESKYHSADYNCNHCDNTECEHWKDFNDENESIYEQKILFHERKRR